MAATTGVIHLYRGGIPYPVARIGGYLLLPLGPLWLSVVDKIVQVALVFALGHLFVTERRARRERRSLDRSAVPPWAVVRCSPGVPTVGGGGDADEARVPHEPDYKGWFDGVSNYDGTLDLLGRERVTIAQRRRQDRCLR